MPGKTHDLGNALALNAPRRRIPEQVRAKDVALLPGGQGTGDQRTAGTTAQGHILRLDAVALGNHSAQREGRIPDVVSTTAGTGFLDRGQGCPAGAIGIFVCIELGDAGRRPVQGSQSSDFAGPVAVAVRQRRAGAQSRNRRQSAGGTEQKSPAIDVCRHNPSLLIVSSYSLITRSSTISASNSALEFANTTGTAPT